MGRHSFGAVGDFFGGHAGPDFVGADLGVLNQHAADADDGAVADGDAGVDVRAAADKGVVADDDGLGDVGRKHPMVVRAVDHVVCVAYDAEFGDGGVAADLDEFFGLDITEIAAAGMVRENDLSVAVGAQDDMVAEAAVVAHLDVTVNFEFPALEPAVFPFFGELEAMPPRPDAL